MKAFLVSIRAKVVFTDSIADAAYKALDVTSIGRRGCFTSIQFVTQAQDGLSAALSSAPSVRDAFSGDICFKFEEDLVSIRDIAERSGTEREAVRLWAAGKRRDDFPDPAVWLSYGRRLWDWSEVNEWLRRHEKQHDQEFSLSRYQVFNANRLLDGENMGLGRWQTLRAEGASVSSWRVSPAASSYRYSDVPTKLGTSRT